MENIKKIRRVSTGIFDHGPAADQKELRMQYGPDKAISKQQEICSSSRAPRVQASSSKPQAGYSRNSSTVWYRRSFKLQAPSDASSKQQASSPKQQASSFKPQASSFVIREPRNIWISFEDLGPWASAMINVFSGCDLWNAIWCAENLSLFPRVTFNSTVKKVPELL